MLSALREGISPRQIAKARYKTEAHKQEKEKRFYKRIFGILYKDVSWYTAVAERMRIAQRFPAPVVEIIDAMALLTLGSP